MNSNETNRIPASQRESFAELLGHLAKNSVTVVHDEIELLIQGVREKIRETRSGVLTVTVGAVILLSALLSLCAALIIGLSSYMTPVIAALSTGVTLALLGVVIVFVGYKQVKKRAKTR